MREDWAEKAKNSNAMERVYEREKGREKLSERNAGSARGRTMLHGRA